MCFEERDGCGSDLGGFAHHPGRRPLRIAAMGTRHVLGRRRVAVAQVRARMARNPLAFVEDLDCIGGDAHIDDLADQS